MSTQSHIKDIAGNENPVSWPLYTLLTVRGWRGRILDIALGALAVLGQAPFHLWGVMLIVLALLKLRLDYMRLEEGRPAGRAFYIAGRFGFGYFLFGLFWIGSAFIARGPAFIPLMPPMIIGLALLLALFWAVAGYFYKGSRLGAFGSAIAFTALFSLAEFGRGHILSGLPWNLTGYIFPAGGQISQNAAYIGVYGLTCLVFLISAALSSIVFARRKPRLIWGPVLACGLILALFVSGQARLSGAKINYVNGVKLRIAQVPFDQKDKLDAQKSVEIVNQFLEVSLRDGLGDISHIIWPEGAVNGLVLRNRSLIASFGQALIARTPEPPVWLLQTLRHEQKPFESDDEATRVVDQYYNSSAAITFDGQGNAQLAAFSDKSKLVPFGEFIPGGKLAERLGFKTLSTVLASLSPAQQKENSDYPGLPRVSAQICYEIIFPGLTPRSKTAPAQWILNQSNDAWYGRSIGPHQHFNQARYRAIEEGLPLIRAASNGLSGAVDPYGRVLKQAGARENIALDVRLPKSIKPVVEISVISIFLLLIILFFSILYARDGKGY